MADINGLDQSGQPLAVPQEAAASEYKAGRLKFKPGDRVPITLNGVAGTVEAHELDAAVQEGAELNFDPHGTAKAGVVGALSSASLGATDWLAVEGSRLLHGDQGAQDMKTSLRGLREEHPAATAVGGLAGAIVPLLIPGGEEAAIDTIPEGVNAARDALEVGEAGGVGAREASAADQVAGPAAAQAEIQQGTQLAHQVAANQAITGATRGSLLARTLRATNPWEYVGKAGSGVETALGRLLGDSKAAQVGGSVARFGTEGAIIGLADAADEDEIGDPNLTAESYLASAEHGALWGSALGLVGTGAIRILTGAGRMAGKLADRLSEAQLGGSPTEMGRIARRYGRGNVGRMVNEMMLEMGESPLQTAEQRYRMTESFKEKVGDEIGRVVRDAKGQADLSAKEVRDEVHGALETARERFTLAGGQGQLIDALKRDFDEGIGWMHEPEPPPPIMPNAQQETYQDLLKQENIPPLGKAPKLVTENKINSIVKERFMRNRSYFKPNVADLMAEKDKQFAEANAKYNELKATKGWNSPEAVEAGRELVKVQQIPVDPKTARELGASRRAKEIEALSSKAREQYGKDWQAWTALKQKHEEMHRLAWEGVRQQADDNITLHLRNVAATQAHNENLRVGFESARGVRAKWDKMIPWNSVNNPDAMIRAQSEMQVRRPHGNGEQDRGRLRQACQEDQEPRDPRPVPSRQAALCDGERHYADGLKGRTSSRRSIWPSKSCWRSRLACRRWNDGGRHRSPPRRCSGYSDYGGLEALRQPRSRLVTTQGCTPRRTESHSSGIPDWPSSRSQGGP